MEKSGFLLFFFFPLLAAEISAALPSCVMLRYVGSLGILSRQWRLTAKTLNRVKPFGLPEWL